MVFSQEKHRFTVRFVLFIALLMISVQFVAKAQIRPGNFTYKGFSGGMMLHSGYVSGGKITLNNAEGTAPASEEIKGMPFGIGGAIRFHFGDHWRIGSEGYSTTLNYGNYHSNASIGWGGALVDYLFGHGDLRPFSGITLGGGSVKNLTLLQETPVDLITEQAVSYRKYSFMAFCPFIGLEYTLTERVHIIGKIDYLMNLSNPQDDFVRGPRIYIGFMFYHINP